MNNSELFLEQDNKSKFKQLNVFSSPRVNLKFTNNDKYNKYIMANYRYLIHPNKIMKNIYSLIIKLYHTGHSEEQINQLTLIKTAKIQKMTEMYNLVTESDLDEITDLSSKKSKIALQRLICEKY
jgi:hypothetical protein